jgi:hypothetical protein
VATPTASWALRAISWSDALIWPEPAATVCTLPDTKTPAAELTYCACRETSSAEPEMFREVTSSSSAVAAMVLADSAIVEIVRRSSANVPSNLLCKAGNRSQIGIGAPDLSDHGSRQGALRPREPRPAARGRPRGGSEAGSGGRGR